MAKAKKMSRPDDEQFLPDMAPERNERVHRAAKVYAKLRDARMEASENESAGKVKLMDVMKEEGLESYEFGGVVVTLTNTADVKVKIAEPARAAETEE